MFVFFRCKVVNPHWYPSSAFGLLFCRCLFLELARSLLTCLHSQTIYFNFFPVALQGSSDHRKAEITSGCRIVNATAVLLSMPSTQNICRGVVTVLPYWLIRKEKCLFRPVISQSFSKLNLLFSYY